jgi:hypothetical protein
LEFSVFRRISISQFNSSVIFDQVMLNIVIQLLLLVAAVAAWKHAWVRSPVARSRLFSSVDPNFEAHLSSFLRAGLQERPSKDLGTELRNLYKVVSIKHKAANELKPLNTKLAAEVQNLGSEYDMFLHTSSC